MVSLSRTARWTVVLPSEGHLAPRDRIRLLRRPCVRHDTSHHHNLHRFTHVLVLSLKRMRADETAAVDSPRKTPGSCRSPDPAPDVNSKEVGNLMQVKAQVLRQSRRWLPMSRALTSRPLRRKDWRSRLATAATTVCRSSQDLFGRRNEAKSKLGLIEGLTRVHPWYGRWIREDVLRHATRTPCRDTGIPRACTEGRQSETESTTDYSWAGTRTKKAITNLNRETSKFPLQRPLALPGQRQQVDIQKCVSPEVSSIRLRL